MVSRARAIVVVLAFSAIFVLSSVSNAAVAAKSKKRTAAKSVANKTAAKKTAVKSHTAVRKTPARTTARGTKPAVRGPRTSWKETIDRASRGNSAEGDDLSGEDLTVRDASLSALGPLNGSVLVTDPKSGRILSVVNQRLAFSGGEQPCSTIKLPVALAALSEGVINRDTQVKLTRRSSMNLTEAIAHSNNKFFENLGSSMGFEKVSQYATEFGFGELAGYHIQEEQLGTFPQAPPSFGGIARMSSFGQDIQVTPLQLAAFVSAIANGGTLYYLQRPKTPEELEAFQPQVKRHLNVQPLLGDLREGMMAAVDHGTGRRAQTSFDTVFGKTGTCSHDGNHLGWFASFSGNQDPRLSVVVLLRGGHYAGGGHAAEVAGKVYRNLYEQKYPALADNRAAVTASAVVAVDAAPAVASTTLVPQP